MFTFGALHVIASSILLNADVTLGTVFSVSTNVVGCFRVICTLREPFPDCGAVCGGVIHLTTLETEDLVAPITLHSASSRLLYPDNHGTVCTRAQLELVMTLHIVPEEVAPVFVFQFFIGKQRKHKVLWCTKWTVLSHTRDPHTHAILDKN
jgi:hypothetical protein